MFSWRVLNFDNLFSDRAVLNKKLEAAQAICDVAWENVNTGHWKDVPLGWRQLYSYGSIFKTIFQSFLGEPLLDILHTCDMGLLMGAPVMENMLSKIASKLHSLLPMQISPEALEKVTYSLTIPHYMNFSQVFKIRLVVS